MQITVNRESFLKLLDTLSRGLEKTPLPINETFMFKVEGDKCHGHCKNGMFEIKGFVQVDSDEDHSFCIPAKTFHDTIRLLGNFEDIIIKNTVNDVKFKTTITVKGGKKKYNIMGWDPNDFSVMGMPEDTFKVEVGAEEFTTAMKNVAGVVKDDIRGGLKGVSIKNDDKGRVEVWGANQHTIGGMTLSNSNPVKESIIPKNIAMAIESIAKAPHMEIHTANDRVRLVCGSNSITGMLIDEKVLKFADFWDMIKPDRYIVIDRLDFLGALKRLKLYSLSENSTMVFEINDDIMILSSQSESGNMDAQEELDVDNHNTELKVGFNPSFVIHAIEKSASEKLVFEFGEKNNHLFIKEHESGVHPIQRWCVPPVII